MGNKIVTGVHPVSAEGPGSDWPASSSNNGRSDDARAIPLASRIGNLDTRRDCPVSRVSFRTARLRLLLSLELFTMNIGLFGGTFDPVHRGHLAFAQEALDRYKLHRIYFVPAHIPPHKQHQPLSPFVHRFAMLALATARQKAFIPSLLEAPEEDAAAIRTNPIRSNPVRNNNVRNNNNVRSNLVRNNNNNGGQEKPNYTIDTVRRLKQSFKASDKLFVLIGMDAFADIAKWHQAEALFRECEFVVANRPGYSLADVANALPESLRPRPEVTKPFHKHAATGDLVLKGATIHLLGDLHQAASATAIRQAAAVGKPLGRFVDALVAEYLQKIGLYRAAKQSSHFDGLRTGSGDSRQVAGARNAPASPRK